MDQPPPTLSETIVSAVHGNAAVSDSARPVSISHHAGGVVLTPPTPASPPVEAPSAVGMVHFALPTLPPPRQEPPRGPLAGRAIISSSLEISVAPYSGQPTGGDDDHGDSSSTPLHGPTKVIRVDLYAGRERLGSWGRDADEQPRQPLPADRDFRIHVLSDIYGESEDRLSSSRGGLGVTLTIEFRGETPAIMLSSVALVQTLGLIGWGG